MAEWITPIFDRTAGDVSRAIRQISEWTKNGFPSETPDLKGCLNASDLNRIEGNTAYLSETLTEYGYPSSVETKTWGRDGLPNRGDVDRVIGNVRSVIESFYTHPSAPPLPSSMLRYEEINSIEHNLYLLKELLDSMIPSFRLSGTIESGSKTVLPLRRYSR